MNQHMISSIRKSKQSFNENSNQFGSTQSHDANTYNTHNIREEFPNKENRFKYD